MRSSILWLVLLGAGCAASDNEDDDKPNDDDGDDDDDNDPTGDTSGDRTEYWEPVAVGFEYDGTILSNGSTGSFLYDDEEAATTYERYPIMILTFASQAFFEDDSLDDEERLAQTCVATGLFWAEPVEKPDQIPTYNDAVLFWSYEVALDIFTEPDEHDCIGKVDPEIWGEDAENLLGPFDGARFGYGWGEQTDYLREVFGEETLADEEIVNAMVASYIAINNLDDVWEAEDWTTGFTFKWDEVTGYRELIDDPENPDEQLLVYDDMSDLVVGGPMPPVYMRSNAYWYQDFVLLDLSNLHDNAP